MVFEIVSLFSGVGGLDLGFSNAGFRIAFANDNDKDVWETFERNHGVQIDKRSIKWIKSEEVPDALGFVGGPPCQSWSLAGAMRGVKDSRGKLFYEYLRLIEDKKPIFFLAENVAGIVSRTHKPEFDKIVKKFDDIGYNVSWKLLNAKSYLVPQDRKRVIIVGYRKDTNKRFKFPEGHENILTLKDAIDDMPESVPAKEKNIPNENIEIPNHEHMIGKFSTIYMSRNRKRRWDEPSFTIQAGGRHAPLHPSSTDMIKKEKDYWEFKVKGAPHRRLSVRECARVQTFPDDFIFYYNNVAKGYKMIGNAVPVKLAEILARKIMEDLRQYF